MSNGSDRDRPGRAKIIRDAVRRGIRCETLTALDEGVCHEKESNGPCDNSQRGRAVGEKGEKVHCHNLAHLQSAIRALIRVR